MGVLDLSVYRQGRVPIHPRRVFQVTQIPIWKDDYFYARCFFILYKNIKRTVKSYARDIWRTWRIFQTGPNSIDGMPMVYFSLKLHTYTSDSSLYYFLRMYYMEKRYFT